MSKNRHHLRKNLVFSFEGKQALPKKYLQEKILEYLQEKDIRVLAGKRY